MTDIGDVASGKLFVLTGASGSGKTTLLNLICGSTLNPDPYSIGAIRAPKYSERNTRMPEDGYPDDVTHVERITLADFDVPYVINNYLYGIRFSDIHELLISGKNVFVIISDFRIVRKLKSVLGNNMRSIYISSAIDPAKLRRIQAERKGAMPDEVQKSMLNGHFRRLMSAARLGWWDRVSKGVSDFEEDWQSYATDVRSTEVRSQRIRAFHVRYIDSLGLFDNVILNYSEGNPQEMVDQMRNIVIGSCNNLGKKSNNRPPLYVVAAASGAGKNILMRMLSLIGSDRIRTVSKVTTRAPRNNDVNDGMIAVGARSDVNHVSLPSFEWPNWWTKSMIEVAVAGQIPEEYDFRWRFHKNDDSGFSGNEYAISTSEVNRNIADGAAQIVVSNMQQFAEFRRRWPENVKFLYLHRLISDEEHKSFQLRKWEGHFEQAEARIKELRAVHLDYVRHIAEFDHVLLNTSFQEDLFDQMFNIIDFSAKPWA